MTQEVDPHGRWVKETGWVILDARGRVWGEQFFHDEVAADVTAIRCVAEPYEVRAARRVTYLTIDKKRKQVVGSLRTSILLEDRA